MASRKLFCKPGKPLFISLLVGFVQLCLIAPAYAESNQRKQIHRKAAFIFQMAKFVNWSVDEREPLTFCFFKEPKAYNVTVVLSALEAQGKLKAQGHKVNIAVKPQEHINLLATYKDCSLIYFTPQSGRKIPSDLLKALGRVKLTIGSDMAFIANGGLSALVPDKGKLRLYINRANYEESLLKIRSRLLSLARFHPK
jgi:hypothetical protein